MIFISHYKSPIGDMTMASNGQTITGLWFDGQKYDRATIKSTYVYDDTLPIFTQTKQWLDIYFSGQNPDFTPALSTEGSEFKRIVSKIMLNIPFGSTMTYGDIAAIAAKQMGRKSMSAQAVGNAVGHNPISIIIPCHRVVGASGQLTGYAGGLEKKAFLLKLEGISHTGFLPGIFNP